MTDSPSAISTPAQIDPVELGTTRDAFLGGKVILEQPAKGRHRAGLDAVFLAAAIPPETSGVVADLGAGVGAAGLCLASRVPNVSVKLVDNDPLVLNLAKRNIHHENNAYFSHRVCLLPADIVAKGVQRHAAGLTPESIDHAIMNPPYYSRRAFQASPSSARAAAHVLDHQGLEPWIRTATDVIRPGGSLTLIFRADGLIELTNLLEGRFGAIDVMALHPRPESPAIRVLIRAIRASRAPLRLLPGHILHQKEGSSFTPLSQAIMRDGDGLHWPKR